MGDSEAVGPFTRRRRATFAAGRGATLQPIDGRSEAACVGSETTGNGTVNGVEKKRKRSLETAQFQTKNDKRKRRNDIGDRMK